MGSNEKLWNKGNRKTVKKVLKDNNLSLPASKHKGRTKSRNLFKPVEPDQLWETDITYIPTESGMTYLMCIKDVFTKEWQEFHEFRNSMKLFGIRIEYIQKHTPEDNEDIESFHNSIKTDYIWPNDFMDFYDGSIAFEKAFTNYNECGLHSSIDYLPPRKFRRKFLDDPAFRERFEKKEVEVRLNE